MTETLPVPASLQALIHRVYKRLGDGAVAQTFERCLPNTYTTTLQPQPDGTTFVITGDIPAMWLRDSAAQVNPYIPLAKEDPELRRMLSGLIRRHAHCLNLDPYANAFNAEPNGHGHHDDHTAMSDWVWERKFELDSLCYPIRLAYRFWRATGDSTPFDAGFHRAMRTVLATMRAEQHHETSPYRFERPQELCLLPSDTLTHEGRGNPVAYTGMVWSGFRPSDDACTYGYLVPANMMAVVELGHLAEIAEEVYSDADLAEQAQNLCVEIEVGIQKYAVVQHPEHGRVYAYETDGLGNHLLMDDANVPSLLSIPYLGYRPASDPIYQNTRRFVLSQGNPSFFAGRAAEGVGSPHTPKDYIWPIALAMQGLTAQSRTEKEVVLELLVRTDGGTGLMHESFHKDDPNRFTRPWFAWANSLFAELVVDLISQPEG